MGGEGEKERGEVATSIGEVATAIGEGGGGRGRRMPAATSSVEHRFMVIGGGGEGAGRSGVGGLREEGRAAEEGREGREGGAYGGGRATTVMEATSSGEHKLKVRGLKGRG